MSNGYKMSFENAREIKDLVNGITDPSDMFDIVILNADSGDTMEVKSIQYSTHKDTLYIEVYPGFH
jgi:hypothetical protein